MKLTQKQYDVIITIMETVFRDGMRMGGAYVSGDITKIPSAKASPPICVFQDLVDIEEKTNEKIS